MNFAHLHLMLNHLPLLTIPMALVFLGHSLSTGHLAARRFAYLVLVLSAATVVPVYFSGEPAEEVVEGLPGVGKPFIEEHEEAAEVSMILTLLAGGTSLIGLFAATEGRRARTISRAVIVLNLVAVASLAYTANLGGKIQHSELRSEGGASE